MAKKQDIQKDESSSIFDELISQHNKVSPESAIIATDMYSKVSDFIPTGSTAFDRILSNRYDVGGWPCGRIIEVYGPESTGKSTLAYQAMKNTQKIGGICIFIDAEQAGSLEMMQNCGVDTNKVVYSRLSQLEEIFEALENNLKFIIEKKLNKKPNFVCVDSIAALTTESEDEGGYEFNMNVSTRKAVLIGKALRKIVPLLGKANAVLYMVNQIRDKIGVMFGDPTTTPGGKAIRFFASIRVKLSGKSPVVVPDPYMEQMYNDALTLYEKEVEQWKLNGKRDGHKPEKPKKQDFKGDDILIGYDVSVKTEKNKVAPPHREAQFRLIFAEGVVDEHSWLDYGIKFNLIKEVSRGEFKVEGFEETFKRNEWLDIVCDEKIHTFVKNGIINNIVRSSKSDQPTLSNIEELDEELKEALGEGLE